MDRRARSTGRRGARRHRPLLRRLRTRRAAAGLRRRRRRRAARDGRALEHERPLARARQQPVDGRRSAVRDRYASARGAARNRRYDRHRRRHRHGVPDRQRGERSRARAPSIRRWSSSAVPRRDCKQLLDAAKIRWRIIVVSTCYAGAWVDALKDDETAVVASSAADVRGADCAGGREPTSFGSAFFDQGMRRNDDLMRAFESRACSRPTGARPRR